MSSLEAFNLLTDVQQDYAAMVRELNRHKRLVNPVDPWTMPLMERMTKARRDLAMAAGVRNPASQTKGEA